jgi:predicted RNA-binding protein with PUA-like domain
VNYWIFKCNPDLYDIDGRLRDPTALTTWNATRYRDEMMPGDIAFMWRTGKRSGIVAEMTIESRPQEMDEIMPDARYWKDKKKIGKTCRVLGTFRHRTGLLPRETILATPGLENLSVFHGFQQATNFRVSPEEGRNLMVLIEGRS